MSDAILAIDVGFKVETAEGSGVYFELEEVTNVVPPSATTEQVDVTHMKSPGRYREFKSSYSDAGEISVEMNHVPGSATHLFIMAWQAASDTRSTQIVYPDGQTHTTPGTFQNFESPFTVGEKVTGTLTIKAAGEPVWAA